MLPARVLALCCAIFLPLVAHAESPTPKEADVRAFVERWRAAQNQGDFAAYEKLYADRYTGVRRSGPRMVRLDRAGWLRDRKRMFVKKVNVDVAELTVSVGPGTAVVRFVQTWASERYRDVGPKLMVLVTTSNGLRIAREELLRSSLDAPAKPALRDAHLFVVDDGAVVLETAYADDEALWSSPQAKELESKLGYAAAHALDRSKLPPSLSAYVGARVRLYNDAEEACTATIRSLRATSRWDPHFGTKQEWAAYSERKRAKMIYEQRGAHFLEGVLDKGCAATWARADTLPKLVVATPVKASDADTRSALAAFRKLPEHVELQTAYVAWAKETSHHPALPYWDTYAGPERDSSTPIPEVHTATLGKTTWIAVAGHSGMGCADWEGSLFAVWVKDTRLTLRATLPENLQLAGVADLDGDGKPEWLLIGGAYVRLDDDGKAELVRLEIPSYDCPC